MQACAICMQTMHAQYACILCIDPCLWCMQTMHACPVAPPAFPLWRLAGWPPHWQQQVLRGVSRGFLVVQSSRLEIASFSFLSFFSMHAWTVCTHTMQACIHTMHAEDACVPCMHIMHAYYACIHMHPMHAWRACIVCARAYCACMLCINVFMLILGAIDDLCWRRKSLKHQAWLETEAEHSKPNRRTNSVHTFTYV